MTRTQRAYLAGLIDGEGCITMSVIRGPGNHPCGITHIRLWIGMCDEPLIRWVAEITGGVVQSPKRSTVPKHWKPIYSIDWTGKTAAKLLRLLLPFLRLKKPQALLLIEWVTLAERERRPQGRRGGPAYPEWVLARRGEILQAFRTLNQRGRILSEQHETAS